MRIKFKRAFTAAVSVLLLVSAFCLPITARAENEYEDEGKMNLDVVFVVDASGSMLYSDPDGIASEYEWN